MASNCNDLDCENLSTDYVSFLPGNNPYEGVELYGCGKVRNNSSSDSGSDSPQEEDSPYGSPAREKYETRVISGKGRDYDQRAYRRHTTESLPQQNIPIDQSRAQPPPEPDNSKTNPTAMSGKEEETPKSQANTCYKQFQKLVVTGSQKDKFTVFYPPELAEGNPDANRSDNHSVDKSDGIQERLKTFYKHSIIWPHESPSAEKMAQAGFVYQGPMEITEDDTRIIVNDMVKCTRCNKTMYKFNQNDDPVEEHRKLNPDCI